MLSKPIQTRLALGAGALATLAATTGGAIWWALFRRPLPRTTGTLSVEGISAPIQIARDRWGVPHVRASSIDDAWFGEGFCHGQDRLWQLEVYRRVAAGRLAEIAGGGGVALDRFIRTLGMHRVARRRGGRPRGGGCSRRSTPTAPG